MTDWTMEPIASKPARLAGASAESSAAQQQIALGSSVFTPPIENVRSANYANCCAFGKEAGAPLNGITTVEGANRILRHCKKALLDSIAVKEEAQREVGRTTLFKGIAAQEDRGAGGGRAGGGGESTRRQRRSDRRDRRRNGKRRNGKYRTGERSSEARGAEEAGEEEGTGEQEGGTPKGE